jgi:ATP-dependent RNA helicase DOB1
MEQLSEEDRRLPQVASMLPLLRRGIGVHHSGLLPIVKEGVEIMFQEGLLRCLFATETFSTGLNMPARTVVFTGARKYDGAAFRFLSSGEYIQMSGRAGRRGLDARGVVILMLDERMEAAVAKDMLRGAPDALYSAFHLTYATLLNIMRLDGAEPEALLRASFRQFQAERALPALEARAEALEARASAVAMPLPEEQASAYAALAEQRRRLRAERRAVLTVPAHALPFLQPGRVCRVCRLPPDEAEAARWAAEAAGGGDDDGLVALGPPAGPPGGDEAAEAAADAAVAAAAEVAEAEAAEALAAAGAGPNAEHDAVWAVVVNFERVGGDGPRAAYAVDVLLRAEDEEAEAPGGRAAQRRRAGAGGVRLLPAAGAEGAPRVVQLPLAQLDALSQLRLHLPQDLRPAEARASVAAALGEVLRRFPAGVPMLDAEEDIKVEGSAFRKLVRRLETVEDALATHPLAAEAALPAALGALARRAALASRAAAARAAARAARSLVLRDELKARRRVLKRLGYLGEDGLVATKGRVAAEIASCDELVATELMFNGVFSDLQPDAIAALVSCLVWGEKSTEKGGGSGGGRGQPGAPKAAGAPKLREELAATHAKLRETARRVAKVEHECRMTKDVEEYVDSFKPDLMELCYAWARGAKFAELMKTTSVFEGSVIRTLRRMEELLRQLGAGAGAVGEAELAGKFAAAAQLLKRDIVFAASLFL